MIVKVHESKYKQCGQGGGGNPVTPHLSIEKILRKDNNVLIEKGKYWHNQFRKAFWPQIMRYVVTR